MEVQVKFLGIPGAIKAVGQKEVTVQLDTPTLGTLLRHLEQAYGKPLRDVLFTRTGEVDTAIQILHNGKDFVARDDLGKHLQEGDDVTFLMMVGGG